MPMSRSIKMAPRTVQWTLVITLVLASALLVMIASARHGDPLTRLDATRSQGQLEQRLRYAQQIGVPANLLFSIQQHERQLKATHAPWSVFSDQPINAYYQRLDRDYRRLTVQLQGIISSSTEHLRQQASQDLRLLQQALNAASTEHLPVQRFSELSKHVQQQLSEASLPKDYLLISSQTQGASHALATLISTMQQLSTFKKMIALLQIANLDVTDLQRNYQHDQEVLNASTSLATFQQLGAMIAAQYRQATVSLTQAFPSVSQAMVALLDRQIQQLRNYGVDTALYQKKLLADRSLAREAQGIQDYQTFAVEVSSDIIQAQNDVTRAQLGKVVQQFHQEADDWGRNHSYADSYNGLNYPLDAGYQWQGIGSDLNAALAAAGTAQDFQNVRDQTSNALFNLHMLEANYNDTTPYDQPHATDLQLFKHYQLHGQVLVVSLTEQVMRIYQDGKLAHAFQVTTGRPELPSLPGLWSVMSRQSPTLFRSGEPRSSPYWYPDTPIHYAMLYHAGGYYIHDSWWRDTYGAGTQFPHADASGNQSFSGNGSHGCINMQENQAAWVYNNTGWDTSILIY